VKEVTTNAGMVPYVAYGTTWPFAGTAQGRGSVWLYPVKTAVAAALSGFRKKHEELRYQGPELLR
jgi:hypothetical protein